MSGFVHDFCVFLGDTYRSRWLLYELTKHDFRARYLGSYFGIAWTIVQPLVTLAILWFIFEVGFKVGPEKGAPFFVWLMAGMVPWYYISECMASTTNAVIDKGFLVSKVVFRASILPITKIVSGLIIHLFFLGLLLIFLRLFDFHVTVYYVQIPYYLAATMLFLLGVGWATSALTVVLRDMSHFMGILLQFLFWLTPIFWSADRFPKYAPVLMLNPLYYIVEGYRECLIYGRWFWEPWLLMIYFWTWTIVLLVGGALVFKRLRPHFGDLL